MLLLLLLTSQHEQPRVLIDTLLKIGRRSAAAIARAAQVQPANLSRLRQKSGEGQVSLDNQSRLLRALWWTNGHPELDQIHEWVVRDEGDARAVEWLLKDKLRGIGQLREVSPERQASRSTGSHAWIGRLDEFGAYCSIIIDGSMEMGQSFKRGVGRCSKKLPGVQIPSSTYYLLIQGKLGPQELKDLVDGKKGAPENPDFAEHYKQLVCLGMSSAEYQKLILHWLGDQARLDPGALENKLAEIPMLCVGGTTMHPQAMTQKQRKKFIANLAANTFEHLS